MPRFEFYEFCAKLYHNTVFYQAETMTVILNIQDFYPYRVHFCISNVSFYAQNNKIDGFTYYTLSMSTNKDWFQNIQEIQ